MRTLTITILSLLALLPSTHGQTPARTTNLGGGCGNVELRLPFPLGLGQAVALEVTGGSTNAAALLGISAGTQSSTSLGQGCVLHLDPATLITVPFVTSGLGSASLPITIPSDPLLIGTEFNAQCVVFGVTGPLSGSELSNGLRARVGQPITVLIAGDRFIDQSHSSVVSAGSVLGINPSVLVNDNNPVTQGNPWLPRGTSAGAALSDD